MYICSPLASTHMFFSFVCVVCVITLQNHPWHYTGQVQVGIRRYSDFFRGITQQRTLTTVYLKRERVKFELYYSQ